MKDGFVILCMVPGWDGVCVEVFVEGGYCEFESLCFTVVGCICAPTWGIIGGVLAWVCFVGDVVGS